MYSTLRYGLRTLSLGVCAIGMVFVLSSCDTTEDFDPNVSSDNRTIADRILNQSDRWGLGDFSAAVDTSNLEGRLDGEGPFTVFAPDGLDTIEDAELEALLQGNSALLSEVLQLHVVEGQGLKASELEDGQTLSTLDGTELTVERPNDTTITVNEVPLVTRSIQSSNGVLHTIDRVLLSNQPLSTRIQLSGGLSTLEAALGASGLSGGLPDGVTLFAPVDDAFGSVETETLLNDTELLNGVLRHHVVDQTITREDLTDGATFTALDGSQLSVEVEQVFRRDQGVVVDTLTLTRVNGQVVRTPDQLSSNGRLHTIGGALLGSQPIPQRVRLAPFLQTVEEGLSATGLDDALSGQGPFTVIAPSARGFAALPPRVGSALLEEENRPLLEKILRNHVIPNQEIRASDLLDRDGQEIQTLLGETVKVSVNVSSDQDTTVSVGGFEIARSNLRASNGVLHTINGGVLTPSALDVVQVGVVNGLTRLGAATAAVGIRDDLQDENSTYTILGPIDQAFQTYLDNQGVGSFDQLSESQKDELRSILRYHVIPREVKLNTIRDGQTEKTLEGSKVTFTVGNEVKVNGVTIQTADIEGTNGLVHEIGEILQPPE
ncbi:MAG: fasciclin domain-containing protein [Salinibacter sp.]|uniref:fasciclin domain-containing protein n=1 Tax=Salinibacter sp. TaxID=2065818 RepID=UPI0035D49A31